jgi:hypothetical protein
MEGSSMLLGEWLTGWLAGLRIEVTEPDVMADLEVFPAGDVEVLVARPAAAVR